MTRTINYGRTEVCEHHDDVKNTYPAHYDYTGCLGDHLIQSRYLCLDCHISWKGACERADKEGAVIEAARDAFEREMYA